MLLNSRMHHLIVRLKEFPDSKNFIGVGFQIAILSLMALFMEGCSDPCDAVECLNEGICVEGDCICAEGWTGSDCSIETSNSAACESVEFDGHTYEVVAIGSQCWFKENLRSDNYRNGDAISDLSDDSWTSTAGGDHVVYGEDQIVLWGSAEWVANLDTYGRLYNWYAVNDARGLCPTGWHVPTDAEWTALTDFLGGADVAGQLMKSSPSDSPSWDGNNASNFSALPGGYRSGDDGDFYHHGQYGRWWSASSNGPDYAWYRYLNSENDDVYRYTNHPRNGYSVRCVRN